MGEHLSVIIPVHNAEAHLPGLFANLRQAVDAQTHVIVVDDASTDQSHALLNTAPFDLEVVRHDEQRGVSAARNTGLRAARSAYVTFLDADDSIHSEHFRRLRRCLDDTGVDMVRTDHLEVRGKERRIRRIPSPYRDGRVGDPRDSICPAFVRTAVDHPNVWAGAFHRRLLDRGIGWMPEDLRTAEDRVWTWDMFLHARSYTVPPHVGVRYHRDVTDSLSRVADERQLDFFRAADAIVDLIAQDPEAERFLPKAVRRTCELFLHHLAHTQLPGPLDRTFGAMAAEHFASLPGDVRTSVLAGLRADRRARILHVIGNES